MNTTKITINSHDVVLKFGMRAAKYLQTALQSKYCGDGDELTEIGIAHIFYAGHLNDCAIKNVPESYSVEFFVDFIESSLLDKEALEEIKRVVMFYMGNQSQAKDSDAKGVEAKKKTSKK
jgi:hypothetical protein